jgi:hypothetical protein
MRQLQIYIDMKSNNLEHNGDGDIIDHLRMNIIDFLIFKFKLLICEDA